MNAEMLYDAITLIDDDLIDEAGAYVPKKKVIHWKRWTALAACLVLVVGVGGGAFLLLFGGGMGGASSGGGGADGSSTFMSYAGPVFPLTAIDDSEGITARRDITLDFAPWVPLWISNEEEAASRTHLTEEEQQEVLADHNERYPEGGRYTRSSDIIVTDAYTLTNSTGEDKTLTVLYPFATSLRELGERTPTLSAGGAQLETTLRIGPYSGGFEGAWGSEDSGELLNLDQLNSWSEYKALLESGDYLEKALSEFPDLSGTDVIVYEFTDAWGDPESKDKPNPSLRVTFELDYDKTTVLSYGFHSASFDRERGFMGQGFSIREPGEHDYGEPYYLIVLGPDVENMETAAYVTGGWDTKEELDDFGVTIRRYETDLDAILRQVAGYIYGGASWQYGSEMGVDFETWYGLYCDHLLSFGLLAQDGGIHRYDTGWLSDLSEVGVVDRVCYLEGQLTIPAGESVTLTAVMTKAPSYDHYCAHTENQGVSGYDMVTRLGSTLAFTGQSASLEDHGQIEIVRQNFGFDPEAGINTVELSMAVEHYYLEVRRPAQAEDGDG